MKIEKGIEKILDLKFLKKEIRGFGIAEVNTKDPSCSCMHPDWIEEESWKSGFISKLTKRDTPGNYYKLHFNPKLDRKKAAQWLSERIGIKILPTEVYIYGLFHELSHTRKIAGDLSIDGLFTSIFMKGPSQQKELYFEAEKKADSYAIKRFIEFRKNMKCEGRAI